MAWLTTVGEWLRLRLWFVPALFTIGAGLLAVFFLLLGSVGAFIWYIDHMAHAIRASTVITSIWAETTAAIDRLYPEPVGAEAETDAILVAYALDRLHDLLRRLATRRFPSRERVVEGTVRLVLPRPGWEDYVRLAVDEISQAGDGQIQVVRRLRSMLEDLHSIVQEDRLAVLRQERQRIEQHD